MELKDFLVRTFEPDVDTVPEVWIFQYTNDSDENPILAAVFKSALNPFCTFSESFLESEVLRIGVMSSERRAMYVVIA